MPRKCCCSTGISRIPQVVCKDMRRAVSTKDWESKFPIHQQMLGSRSRRMAVGPRFIVGPRTVGWCGAGPCADGPCSGRIHAAHQGGQYARE